MSYIVFFGTHLFLIDNQEALLTQTDRATRRVSRNLANCCTTLTTSCTTHPERVEVTKLDRYSRPTCSKLCASSHDARDVVGVIHKLDRRRVLLNTPSTCRGEIFQVQRSGQSSGNRPTPLFSQLLVTGYTP